MVSHEDFFFTTDKTWQKLPKGPRFSRSFLSPRIISPLCLPSPQRVGGIDFVELWAHSFLSEQEAPAACSCLAATPEGWQVLPRGLSTQSLPLPAQAFFPQESQCQPFLATTVAIWSRSELLQKPWCPGGSRTAELVASKESSWASSPLPDYILFQGIALKTSPRFLTLFMSWCSHGNSSYARNSSSLEWQRKHKFTRQRFFQRLTELMGLWEEIPAEAQTQGCSW